ncbi:MAG: hypothetical protein ACYSUI_01395 [Planctomycetota bacterium]
MKEGKREFECASLKTVRISLLVVTIAAVGLARAQTPAYTLTNLGKPPDADTVAGVRMNNLGHVAGYSIYYGQGEPSIKPWFWTSETGFTVLPPPPNMFLGRARAMDINDAGVVAGDGGFDAGIAWRWDNGQYETFGQVDGLPVAYLGGVNNAGDVAGTAKDAQFGTPDKAFLDVNDVGTINLTPNGGSRATDVNNARQVCGYSQSLSAFRWDEVSGMQFLGTAGLAYSFGNAINDLGQVVGSAQSATGNTVVAWIYTDGLGQQIIPAPPGKSGAANINSVGHVVGNTEPGSGPDLGWLWAPQLGTRTLFELYDYVAAGLSAVVARDINDAGQILAHGYDSNAGEFRTILLTPVETGVGACCLPAGGCSSGVTASQCAAQGGVYLGNGTSCVSCTPVGACCLTDGDCVEFQTEAECAALAGAFQGANTSCVTASCQPFLLNDDCADAIPIELGDTPFSTLGATTDGPDLPASCMEPAGLYLGMDIWYVYEPEGTGTLTVSTCNQADYDTRLAAYTGFCGGLQIAGCNDDVPPPTCYYGTSIMDVPVTCGQPVLIRVGSFSVYTGTGTLTLSFEGGPCTPCQVHTDCDDGNPCTDDVCGIDQICTHAANNAGCDDGDSCTTVDVCMAGVCVGTVLDPECFNDFCAQPTILCPGSVSGTTTNADSDGSASCGQSSASPDVWYSFTPATDGTATFSTCGSPIDTVLSVHSGCPGTSANEIACNDDACGSFDSSITIGVVTGETYMLRVSGYNGNAGDFVLTLEGPACDPGGPIAGDLDGDGDVDLDDHALFFDCMTGPGGGMLTGCDPADIDGDLDTDTADLAMFQSVFGG